MSSSDESSNSQVSSLVETLAKFNFKSANYSEFIDSLRDGEFNEFYQALLKHMDMFDQFLKEKRDQKIEVYAKDVSSRFPEPNVADVVYRLIKGDFDHGNITSVLIDVTCQKESSPDHTEESSSQSDED